jgi:hypothetical protein
MTERAYIIRQQDRKIAIAFIDNQLNKNPKWLETTEAQYSMAKQEYLVSKANSTSFNTWCQKWLNKAQWIEVRKVIGMNKNHEEEKWRYIEPHKTISVTHHAWRILSALALQDQRSLSEVIINRLGKEFTTISSSAKSRYNQSN